MEFLTGKHLDRRTFVKGMGTSVALPLLDAMVPAGKVWRNPTDDPQFTRFVAVEESMGSAGGSDWGEARISSRQLVSEGISSSMRTAR